MILFLGSERIVMKFGTNSLTKNGRLDNSVIRRIAATTSLLYSLNKKPLIVTSGAVAAGMELNGLEEKPSETEQLQLLSGEGVRLLWDLYAQAFARYGFSTLYIPITPHNIETEEERENIRKIVEEGWKNKKITIWNTNDSLTNEQLAKRRRGFYDNDPLAVELAKIIKADLLMFFTDHGNMGTGGGSSKSRAIEEARKSGIKVEVKSINYLDILLS